MRLALVALTSLGFWLSVPRTVSAQPAQVSPVAAVTPTSGRPGDVIYVAGGNFPAHTPIIAFMACPNWFDYQGKNVWPLGSVAPRDNTRGNFVTLHPTIPAPSPATRTGCTLYIGTPPDELSQASLRFTILGPHDARSRHPLPLSVRLQSGRGTCPRRLAAVVQSAGGAKVTVRESSRRGLIAHRTVHLPWTGRATVPLTSAGQCGQRVKIAVQATLGKLAAQWQHAWTLFHAVGLGPPEPYSYP